MEYIIKKGKYVYNLLLELPPGCKCVKRLYGKELPKDYLYHDINSNQLIKHNTQAFKHDFPYIVINGDKVNIMPKDKTKYNVEKILEHLNRI